MMMKFTCNTTALTQGINSALLAVSPKSTLLALEGIMVQAGFREISLVSYNLEMGITASLEAQVEQMGQIIIPAKMFYDIIRRIESDEVTIEADDRCLVQITGGAVHHSGYDGGGIPRAAGGGRGGRFHHADGNAFLHGGYDPVCHRHQ